MLPDMAVPVDEFLSALSTGSVNLRAKPGELPDNIEELIESLPDPERVRRYLTDFTLRYPAIWRDLTQEKERLRWLLAIFSVSHFLSEEIIRHPEWLSAVANIDGRLSLPEYKDRLDGFLQERGVTCPTALDLALFRRKELLRIVVRDALHAGSLAEITEELSDLAGAILGCALNTVLAELQSRYGVPSIFDNSGETVPARFAVIALGKLGGRELNYSSDIDLMFLYDDNGETSGPHVITNKEFFKKAANQFTNLLSTYTPAGVCYRVDLRLRPEGTLGDVCISLAAAKEYYARRARDWELQMLIKARVAAGDEALGSSAARCG